MFQNFVQIKRSAVGVAILIVATILSACQQGGFALPDLSATTTQRPAVNRPPTTGPARPLSANVSGEAVGSGPVRVALLLPKSGAAAKIGNELSNAAKLALGDFGAGRIQLVIKDTRGQSAEASALASQAVQEGASLVLGPLFSSNVSAASAITLPANIPMIALSSDVARARNGVYLLSFAPNADINRTLTYGLSLGANRVIAMLPNTAYGRLAEQELRRTFDQSGGQIVSVVRYANDTNSIVTAARSIALPLANANAIYIPEGGQTPSLILNSLRRAGVDLSGKQIMGSGLWESVNRNDRILAGAIYAGADKRNYDRFSSRYKGRYGSSPSITASLGYDAVSLAAELVRRNPGTPFNPAAIQSRSGFNGASGLFRFGSNGRLQRGLVINKIEAGRTTVVSPAPANFGNSS